jgi:hypothetical protein
MSCRFCTSENQGSFPAEIAIHLPGLDMPHLLLFPKIVACLDCGFTEVSIPKTEMPRIAKTNSIAAWLATETRPIQVRSRRFTSVSLASTDNNITAKNLARAGKSSRPASVFRT